MAPGSISLSQASKNALNLIGSAGCNCQIKLSNILLSGLLCSGMIYHNYSNNPYYRSLPQLAHDCRDEDEEPMKIISPRDIKQVFIPRDLEVEFSRVVFDVALTGWKSLCVSEAHIQINFQIEENISSIFFCVN